MDILSLNKPVFVDPNVPMPKRPSADATNATENKPSNSANLTAVADTTDAVKNANDGTPSKEGETSKDIESAVQGANRFFEQVSRELRFERSDVNGSMVVKITDQTTGEVIRQIPSEEMLKISKELETISGLLFQDSA